MEFRRTEQIACRRSPSANAGLSPVRLYTPGGELVAELGVGRHVIGADERCDVVLDEASVSGFHCELTVAATGFRVRDLASTNGTLVDGEVAKEVQISSACRLELGRAALMVDVAGRTPEREPELVTPSRAFTTDCRSIASPALILFTIDGDERSAHEIACCNADEQQRFDLFVDTTVVGRRGRRRFSRRNDAGEHVEGWLTESETGALLELCGVSSAVCGGWSARLGGALHPRKIVESLRRKVDMRVSRYEWRLIHSIRRGDPPQRSFVLRAPAGFRLGILVRSETG